ncbi:hypothetical protein DERP_002954 [Dermatophagoides pteronyssinus]|uniref:Uncharacterized protein n=1 Tax=Dermatophagoides pteronyssinus TaxID=6956 RepID=A0ABQ8JWA9_DERPT|nr:hypothetical protein DERP_002954 [Dermatophagoides pteronyssinus]
MTTTIFVILRHIFNVKILHQDLINFLKIKFNALVKNQFVIIHSDLLKLNQTKWNLFSFEKEKRNLENQFTDA